MVIPPPALRATPCQRGNFGIGGGKKILPQSGEYPEGGEDKKTKKERQMKRILITIGIISMVIAGAGAVSVCAKDTVVTVVLDPSVGASASGTYNNSTGTWKVPFPYGNVSGISTCVETTPKSTAMGTTLTSNDTPLDSPGGETSGAQCWCKMTHPMSSLWAFNRSNSACASYCPSYCASYVQNYADLRGGLFGSVAAANAAY